MSEAQSPMPEQLSEQLPEQPPVSSQPVAAPLPPAKRGYSGKQVVGIVVGVLAVLAIGLVAGGAIGYRLGTTAGARQAVASVGTFRSQRTPNQQTPNQQTPNQQTPRSFTNPAQPFNGQQVPSLNPGGPYLGVSFESITPELAAQENITGTTGALVRDVVSGSPAEQAGLKVGDVISAVNGQPVDAQNDLRARVAEFKSGDEVTLTVVKGTANGPTDQHDVKVKLGERPADQSFGFPLPFDNNGMPQGFPQLPFGGQGQSGQAPAAGGAYLGVTFELTKTASGAPSALITSVADNSPAAQAGLKAGESIVAVDGTAVTDAATLRTTVQNHKAGDVITLAVVNATGNQREVKVTLAERPTQFQLPQLDSREG